MKRGRPRTEIVRKPIIKTISKQDRKDLKVLADDFGLLHREDVVEIIENCRDYTEGQQKIMQVYDMVYMN